MLVRVSRNIVLAGLGLTLAACGQQEAPPAPAQPGTTEQPAVELSREELDTRRIADLVAINNALQAYHAQHGNYPQSPQGGFTSVIERGEAWIPELAPAFIAALPRDPTMTNDHNRQYWYASDGTDYKLIVHGVPRSECDSTVERDGVAIDPARNRADGCWAFGFWTSGKRAW